VFGNEIFISTLWCLWCHAFDHVFFSCDIKFKTTLFKGFTRGGPCVPSLMKQNFDRAQKNKVIALKKSKRHFKDVTMGGPWVPSLMKQNFNRTKFMKSFTA